MKKLIFTFLFLLSFLVNSFAQITINNFPEDLQLYKRNQITNSATIEVSGTVNQSLGYTSLTLEVYKNSVLLQSTQQVLNYSIGSTANFNFTSIINAELSQLCEVSRLRSVT